MKLLSRRLERTYRDNPSSVVLVGVVVMTKVKDKEGRRGRPPEVTLCNTLRTYRPAPADKSLQRAVRERKRERGRQSYWVSRAQDGCVVSK